jgi:hypothetical protein
MLAEICCWIDTSYREQPLVYRIYPPSQNSNSVAWCRPGSYFSSQSQCDYPPHWAVDAAGLPCLSLSPDSLTHSLSLSALGFSTVSSILPSIGSRVYTLHKCIVTHIVQLGSQRTQRSMFSTIHGINQQLENLFLFTRCCCCCICIHVLNNV